MKTKEEMNTIENQFEALNAKQIELTADETERVVGGIAPGRTYWKNGCKSKNGDKPKDDRNGAN